MVTIDMHDLVTAGGKLGHSALAWGPLHWGQPPWVHRLSIVGHINCRIVASPPAPKSTQNVDIEKRG